MITKIENYYLDQPIEEATELKEFTVEEYQMFESAGYKRMLNNEKLFYGKNVIFNNNEWITTIGSTNNQIYKITLQNINTNKKITNSIFKSTLNYIVNKMGKYSEHKYLSKKYVWDAPEGNIICKQLNKFNQYCINILITSNSIREQISKLI